ncbi:hypothetical protein EW026_g638 [Hermanssonia centrifuga]|uniref:Uncharacterized protein n=1 Tax=Hermanssonia centrifuga TaxID=98765 RepID=A0A4S4KYQ9_9APHY|nr:hypothetical protein EW026_g638 [Hermanssonia centrifuga]
MFTYEHLNTAFRILLSTPPKPLIATHRAKYIPLEAATGVQAEVVGKPSRTFFEMVIDDFAEDELLPEGRIAIVGDDVETDLGGGAVELGFGES